MLTKRISFISAAGATLCCLGLIAISGWYLHIPIFISIFPGYVNMVPNTAVCFILSGAAFLLAEYKPDYQQPVYLCISTMMLAIAGTTLLEYIFSMSLGVDELFVKIWLIDQNPYPGRMAINTATVFLLTGISFLLLPHADRQSLAIILQVAIFAVIVAGLSALLGYVLKLEFLYQWYKYTRMALHTAAGTTLLGFTLWATWNNSPQFANLYRHHEDKKIALISTMILISISSLSGLAGFVITSHAVNNQLLLISAILSVAITIGILLIHWQISPLVQNIIQAKKEAINNGIRLQTIFHTASEAIITADIHGMIESLNPAAEKMFGYQANDILGKNINLLIPAKIQEKQRAVIKKHLKINKTSTSEEKKRIEMIGLHQNGKEFPIEIALTTITINNEHKFVGMMHDISDRKAANEALSFKAYYDTLTGLVNRSQLEHSLDLTISSAVRSQQRFALFFIDLDHFKHVNDTLGHDAGDELLKIISDRLKNNIRKTDIAARLGGDEFILVLNGIQSAETAALFAEKILNVLTKPIPVKNHELCITSSIGISFYPTDGADHQSLIKSADLALYKAKSRGRNNYQFCTSELNQELQARMAFKKALENAIKHNEFYLTFLPRKNRHGHITSFESLLRWKHQEYGEVSPAKVIPLAEEIGIITQLSDWIVKTSLEQTLAWRTMLNTPLCITINISTRHYFQENFVTNILSLLNTAQLPPKCLGLEISESLIMQDSDYSLKTVRALREAGIQIIIDNFGTGYSSLSDLNQLGVDYIKIDRRFIQSAPTNQQHQDLILAMITLANNLKIKTIADGIETAAQYELLMTLGCDEYQGFYISHPLIAEKATVFLQQGASILQRTPSHSDDTVE